MKKLKISKSKVASNQPTIVHFFKNNIEALPNVRKLEENHVHQIEKTVRQPTKDQTKPKIRHLDSNICSKCLNTISENYGHCNNCNLSPIKFPEHPNTKESHCSLNIIKDRLLKEKSLNKNGALPSVTVVSPDVIPPTPPLLEKIKTKEQLGKKSAKRKFCFSDSNNVLVKKFSTDPDEEDVICQSAISIDTAKANNNYDCITKGSPNLMSSIGSKTDEEKALANPSDNIGTLTNDLLSVPRQSNLLCIKTTADIPQSNDCNFNDSALLENLNFDEAISNNEDIVNLESISRCVVTSVAYIDSCREKVLGLQPNATCVLRGAWVNVVVKEGDIVSVSARPLADQPGCWVVDNDEGMVTVHPDTLVSGTAVVGSLFCQRRSVLSDTYRGMDSDSQIMVLGSFLHQLLQEVLKKNVSSLEGIEKVLNNFTSSKQFIYSLYSSEMSLDQTKHTLVEFVPKIHAFLKKYMNSNGVRNNSGITWNNKDSWIGRITDVADIEENIWASRLGLKGKVDVTVKTLAGSTYKIMPLELKTGRASFSAEHRGQVILYTMMMTEIGQPVDSGLLLYLREGVMKEVAVGPAERRDLILLRNQLVTQLRDSREISVTSGGKLSAPPLPPPIHHSACAKCPYLTLCSAALRSESGVEKLSEGHPLRQLAVSSTQHVTDTHMAYVFHWAGLLRLEHTYIEQSSPALHTIWTLLPLERKKRGTCLANLRLVGSVVEVTLGSYEHVFESQEELMFGMSEGEYLIVSTNCRPAIAAGSVRHIAQHQITLHLERDLSSHYGENVWHLDKYESQSGLAYNITNLGCLLDDTEQSDRLRKAVIDLQLPQFKAKLSSRVLKSSVDLLASLNDQQRRAIFRTFSAEHYILIKGMPGTGKTATIIALVELAVRLRLSVLITSHTHSAVDNVLLRLRGRVDFLRLGASYKIHPELSLYGEAGLTFSTPDQLHEFYNSKSVVGVTCLGAAHPLLSRRKFDLCVVDEATQVLQPTVLRPLFSAHKFILIGDPDQLPPLVRSSKAKEMGLGQSLFLRLDRPAVTSELSQQYRMNSRLTQLANTLTYGGKLQCASDGVAQATLRLSQPLGQVPEWITQALSPSLDNSVVFLETGTTEIKLCVNQVEADIVRQLLSALKEAGVADERVGVMAPYRAQVEVLRQYCHELGSSVEVNTVDQYQGRDKDVVLYSCTRSAAPTGSDILGDKNRLTVAVTRARYKLIFIGNSSLLRGYELFLTIINSLTDNCIISVPQAI